MICEVKKKKGKTEIRRERKYLKAKETKKDVKSRQYLKTHTHTQKKKQRF